MNFKILQIPKANETLDFQNFNIPFIIAQKNKVLLEKYTKKLIEDARKLRIYTETDKITVISNGIKDRFYFDQSGYNLNIEGEVTLKSGSYRKKTEDFGSISSGSILNLEESAYFMIEEGFIPKTHTFDFIVKKSDVAFSNLLSLSEFSPEVFSKVPPFSAPEVAGLRVDNNGLLIDESILAYSDAVDVLIHRTLPTDRVSIHSDNIVFLRSDTLNITSVLFVDGFIPVDDKETVSAGFMVENNHLSDIESTAPIYIRNESLNAAAPINKKQLLFMTRQYISSVDNIAHNVSITDDREEINDDNIVSNKEAYALIEEFFYGIKDGEIDNLAEFKRYLSALCDFDDAFIENSFSISGGKIYLGFDYNNMNSIFNSEAIKSILLNKTGDYDKDIEGITFQSARYFKDQDEINRLSAYAEVLGINIDVSRQRLASTFDSVRRIVAKLCIMSPDIIPPTDIPDMPIFVPDGIMNIIPPVVTPFYIPIILPRLTKPYYIRDGGKILIVMPPHMSYVYRSIYTPTLLHQPYYAIIKSMPVIPPMLLPVQQHIAIPDVRGPIFSDISRICYQRRDGVQDTMVIFDKTGDCRERFIATSNRTLNMMDASAIFSSMNFDDMSYGMYDTGHVATIPEVIAFMIYNTMVCMSTIANIPLNVDFCETIIEVKDEPRFVTGFCSADSESQSSSTETKLEPGKYFILNGVVVDEEGNVSGEHIITGTEWFDNSPIILAPFVNLRGSENADASNAASEAMGQAMKSYIDPVRKSTRSENGPKEAKVSGFENLKSGGFKDGVFMLDYVSLEIIPEADPGYAQGGSSDFMGIWAGSSMAEIDVKEIIAPDIAVVLPEGVAVSGIDAEVIRVWDIAETDNIDIRELPYHVLDDSEKAYYLPPNKLALKDSGNGQIAYDTSTDLSVVTFVEKELINPFGDLEVYKGFAVNGKFVKVTDEGFGGLSTMVLGVPNCDSYPLPLMRTILTPLIIVPMTLRINGPMIVLEGEETSEYFVSMTRTMDCDVVVQLELEDVTTSPDDHDDMPVTEVTIYEGETESEKFTIQTTEDLEREGTEYYKIKITSYDVGECTGIPSKVARAEILTSIFEPPPCFINAFPVSVKEGDTAIVTVTLSKEAEEGGYSFIASTEDGSATGGVDYNIINDVTFVIPEGETSIDIPIPTVLDEENEMMEDLSLLISPIDTECEMAISRVPVLIFDESAYNFEVPNICGFFVTSDVVQAGETAEVSLQLSQTKEEDFDFHVYTVDATAVAGVNYTSISVSGTISAGGTSANFTIPTTKREADDSVMLTLVATSESCDEQTSARAPVTIVPDYKGGSGDDEEDEEEDEEGEGGGGAAGGGGGGACLSQLRPPEFVQEGKLIEVEFILPKPTTSALRIIANTKDVVAVAREDYEPLINAIFVVPPGESRVIIPVQTLNDSIFETTEPFELSVDIPSEACSPVNSPVTIFIFEDPDDIGNSGGQVPIGGGGGRSQEPPIKAVISAGSTKIGCDGSSSQASGINGSSAENISDLTSIDVDTLSQKGGDVPGAATMGTTLQASKIVDEIDPNTGENRRVLKTHSISICGVFGAVDGVKDGKGDILSQGYIQDEIPSGGTPITYKGPSASFTAKTTYLRYADFSTFTMRIGDIIKDTIDLTTGDSFFEGMPIRIADNPLPVMDQINKGEIVVSNIATAGMIMHYKNSGPNADYPVTASYGGSSSTSLTTGQKIVLSSGSPLPTTMYTKADNANAFTANTGLMKSNSSFIFINNDTITVALKDVPAALSQNRTVKFLWG